MTADNVDRPQHSNEPDDVDLEAIGHPRGTLAIVLIYAVLFALGWAFLFFVEFIPRGTPQP